MAEEEEDRRGLRVDRGDVTSYSASGRKVFGGLLPGIICRVVRCVAWCQAWCAAWRGGAYLSGIAGRVEEGQKGNGITAGDAVRCLAEKLFAVLTVCGLP